MGQFTHEITVPGTNYRCYVDAEKMDLDKVVTRVWGRTARDRRRNTPPYVRPLDPGEAEAVAGAPSWLREYKDHYRL